MTVTKRILLAALVLLLGKAELFSQVSKTRLFIGAGHSFTGTGDAPGYAFLNQVDIKLSRRFFLSPGIQLTNHFNTQLVADYTFREVTTGVNLYANMNYLLLNAKKHQIALGAGPVARFQRTSAPDDISYGSTPASNVPRLIVENNGSGHTWALGYNISPSYIFQLSPRFALSAKFSLQNDTRGDFITSEMVLFGISL